MFTIGLDVARLGMESCAVIGLRLAKLAAGGPAAQREARRMVSEKVAAVLEAQIEIARLIALGRGTEAPAKVLAHFNKTVSANRRRLSGKGSR